jgi:hypothetical protein
MLIELTHYCHLTGATGAPGQILDCPEPLAQRLIESGGAKPAGDTSPAVAASATPSTEEPEPVSTPETATKPIPSPLKPRKPEQDRGTKK